MALLEGSAGKKAGGAGNTTKAEVNAVGKSAVFVDAGLI